MGACTFLTHTSIAGNPLSRSDFLTSHESRQTKKTSEKSYKSFYMIIRIMGN